MFRRSFVVGCLLVTSLGCSPAAPPEMGAVPSATPSVSAPPVLASATPSAPKERRMPKGKAEPPRVALGTHGAVASQEERASKAGIDVLARGGNAVDAAVAVAFVLAVTHPSAGNVGGGGFMLTRTASGEVTALDYREMAPRAATRDMYLDKAGKPTKESTLGPKAAGIPGTVAGLFEAHKRFGKLSWAELVAPAITLAKGGHEIDGLHADDYKTLLKTAKDAKFEATARIFSRPDGNPLEKGDKLVQADLAAVLERIAADGPIGFYEGETAKKLASGVKAAGGIWTEEDLKTYRAIWREPVKFTYRGHEIATMPPPSAGGVVLKQVLMGSEMSPLKPAWRTADEVHLLSELMRRSYADRNELLGDPAFVKVPLARVLDEGYIRDRMKGIDPQKATPSSEVKAGLPLPTASEQTTHFSVVDADGMAVSNTYTLNTGYGSKFIPAGTGVLLNNEMDDFAVKPGTPNAYGLVQGEANRVEPGKRMLSSMSPTIISKDGQLRAVLGTPGGSTISTTVAQLTRALIDYGKPLDEAVPAFRAHHQWLPDAIIAENAIPEAVVTELEKRGHKVMKRGRIGHANCIEVDVETRGFRAVADTTRGGGAALAN